MLAQSPVDAYHKADNCEKGDGAIGFESSCELYHMFPTFCTVHGHDITS